MNMKEANEILGEKPIVENKTTNTEIDIFAEAQKSNQAVSVSGFDTLTIKGYGSFKVPAKYLKGNSNYQDTVTGKYAVANGLSSDRKTLKFDRSNSPCTTVKTNEGHEVSLKLDTLSGNLKRYAQRMPEGLWRDKG